MFVELGKTNDPVLTNSGYTGNINYLYVSLSGQLKKRGGGGVHIGGMAILLSLSK